MPTTANKSLRAPTPVDIEVSERIKKLRTARGLTQRAVAEGVGIVHQQYHKYETGFLRLSAGVLVKLCDVFDCSIEELFPPKLRGQGQIDAELRQDVLKQEIVSLLMDISDESELIAFRTLLIGLSRRGI